jgi:hypothetical protein
MAVFSFKSLFWSLFEPSVRREGLQIIKMFQVLECRFGQIEKRAIDNSAKSRLLANQANGFLGHRFTGDGKYRKLSWQ